jgi:hypothetical protein
LRRGASGVSGGRKKAWWYAEEEHVVFGEAVMPGAAHVCAAVEQSGEEWKWERGVEV